MEFNCEVIQKVANPSSISTLPLFKVIPLFSNIFGTPMKEEFLQNQKSCCYLCLMKWWQSGAISMTKMGDCSFYKNGVCERNGGKIQWKMGDKHPLHIWILYVIKLLCLNYFLCHQYQTQSFLGHTVTYSCGVYEWNHSEGPLRKTFGV